jgi:hypothetical protein
LEIYFVKSQNLIVPSIWRKVADLARSLLNLFEYILFRQTDVMDMANLISKY